MFGRLGRWFIGLRGGKYEGIDENNYDRTDVNIWFNGRMFGRLCEWMDS